jgi:D-alanyl-D-alanine carboxypeptidase
MLVKRSKTATLMTAVALLSVGPQASAQKPAGASLEQCVAAEAKKSRFSGVVSIMRPGGTVTHANGLMAGKGSAKMLPDAQFNIGSAGKMWTAVAIAQLVDAKKITLDDPIGRHVSGLTSEASAVTIRQLLTHSGGLGNFFVPENLPLLSRARSLAELKPLVTSDKPTFTPGSKSQYSNSGFLLLGLIIEQASGQSYGDYLQKNVFAPAGMTRSSMMPADPKVRAIGMTNMPEDGGAEGGPPPGPPPGPGPGARMGPPPPGAQPGPPPGPMMMPPSGPLRPSPEAQMMGTSAGGSFSTPSDMQRFFAALLAGKLTSTAMRDALTSPQIELLPAKGPLPAISYGFGFTVANHKGHGWFGHNGGLPGGNVATAAFAKDQVTAVIMANRDPPAADMMLRRVQAMLFDGGACAG